MSGIVGYFNEGGAKQKLLEDMCNRIKYDNSQKIEKYINGKIGVGLVYSNAGNTESQLGHNEDGTLCAFAIGEIFDYGEAYHALRKIGHEFKTGSFAEFCLHSYEEYGESFVEKLNGQFIIVIVEIGKNRLLIFNDRLGTKPFYFFKGEGNLIIGSAIKSIIQEKTVKREVNDEAVSDFFSFGRILGDKTLFKNINVFPQASILKVGENEFSLKRYWDLNFGEEYNHSIEHYVINLRKFLKKAIERRISEKTHFTLSGGLDTRLITSLVDEKYKPLNTFTIGEKGHDDVKLAKEVSKELGSTHFTIKVDENLLPHSIKMGVYASDGMSNCRNFGFFSIIDGIREKCDVIISGSGIGEFLGDYFVNESCFSFKGDEELIRFTYRNFNNLVKENEIPLLFTKEYFKKIRGEAYKSIKKEVINAKKHARIPANIIYYLLFKNDLRHVILSSEYASFKLNTRLPSTDIDYIDFVLKIPPKFRINRVLEYETLRRISPELSMIPHNQTGFPISYPMKFHKIGLKTGNSGAYKKLMSKMGRKDPKIFIPDRIAHIDFSNKLIENLKLTKFFKDILFDKKTTSRPYFNQSYIKNMFVEHLSGKKDNTDKLCAILTFELWHRLFIDQK